MSKRTLLLTLLIGLLVVVLAACAATPAAEPTPAPAEEATQAPAEEATQAPVEEPTAAPAEQPTGEKQTYYEVNALINLPYFIDHQVGLYYAGKVFDVDAPHVGPVDYDMTAMVNTMEQTIATNPQGINIVGFDPALKPSIDAAVDAGIPVVTLDAEVYGSKRLTFLGTGNYNAGRVGGQLLAAAGQGVMNCLEEQAIGLAPLGSACLQPGRLIRRQAHTQVVGKEMMIAIPDAGVVERDEKEIGLLQLL